MNVMCCGIDAVIEETEWDGQHGFGIRCKKCNNAMFDPDKQTAIDGFMRGAKQVQNKIVPIKKDTMKLVFENKKNAIVNMASPIYANDESAVMRLYNNNTDRYPLTLNTKPFDKIWARFP